METPLRNPDDAEKKIDYLFKTINRYDLYINSTNAKASLILAWNGFVLSFILLKYDSILSNYGEKRWVMVVAIISLTLIGMASVLSSIQAFRVVFPYLENLTSESSTDKEQNKSIIFFGSVASMSHEDFYSRVSLSTEADRLRDVAAQALTLARGAQLKMRLVRSSIIAVGAELICLIALLLLKSFSV